MDVNDSFNDGARYTTNPRYTTRLRYVYDKTDTTALEKIASSLRDGLPCRLHPKFSAGEFNLVRVLKFEDGMRWAVRLRMPEIDSFSEEAEGNEGLVNEWKWTERDDRGFRSEVETMLFIRKYTSIPVPEVFATNASPDNPVGFPYVLMSYIDGMTAFDRATLAGQPMRVPRQFFNHYVNQIAAIMNELASIRAPCIGSIYKVPADGQLAEECMGPVAETQSGPWRETGEFYREYPPSLMRTLYGDSAESQAQSGGQKTVDLFVEMFGAHSPNPTNAEDEETDFGLVNMEIGTHNVLVDEEFNVLGVIDWDSTFAAPRAVAHHFPWCIGADPGIPGGVSRVFPPLEGQREITMAFAWALAERSDSDPKGRSNVAMEQKTGQGKGKGLFTVREFFNKEALAFRAIAFFRVRQKWVDEEWLGGFEWLKGRTQEDVWKWYGVTDSS